MLAKQLVLASGGDYVWLSPGIPAIDIISFFSLFIDKYLLTRAARRPHALSHRNKRIFHPLVERCPVIAFLYIHEQDHKTLHSFHNIIFPLFDLLYDLTVWQTNRPNVTTQHCCFISNPFEWIFKDQNARVLKELLTSRGVRTHWWCCSQLLRSNSDEPVRFSRQKPTTKRSQFRAPSFLVITLRPLQIL